MTVTGTPLAALPPPDGAVSSDAWRVEVEVLVLRLLADGVLGHRWLRAPVPARTSPDECAVELARCTDGVCHSTSWRCPEPGVLVVTYAVLPDPEPDLAARPLAAPLVVGGDDPLRPTPCRLDESHVAAHAVRHLADLAERDPVVGGQAAGDPRLWRAVAHAARQAQHQRDVAS